MKSWIKNPKNPSMIYANVRMCKHVWESLRRHLKADFDVDADPDVIRFQYGARLVKQGFGWYRLVTYNSFRGIDKIRYALRVLRDFYKSYCENRNYMIKQFLRPVVEAYEDTRGMMLATPSRLQELAQRWRS